MKHFFYTHGFSHCFSVYDCLSFSAANSNLFCSDQPPVYDSCPNDMVESYLVCLDGGVQLPNWTEPKWTDDKTGQ